MSTANIATLVNPLDESEQILPRTVKEAVSGIENVDNTADASKPVSTAQQAAIDAAKETAISTAAEDATSKSKAVQENLNAHEADSVKHVTEAERAVWDGKQNQLYDLTLDSPILENQSISDNTTFTLSTPITMSWGDLYHIDIQFKQNVIGYQSIKLFGLVRDSEDGDQRLVVWVLSDGIGMLTLTTNSLIVENVGGDITVTLAKVLNIEYESNRGVAQTEGGWSAASGFLSHAEGHQTSASGFSSHAEGDNTTAIGSASHAEGGQASANKDYSHAEGYRTTADGAYSHAEGDQSTASGDSSHAEGWGHSRAPYSHAEGYSTTASGDYSHVEGCSTTTVGIASHAEGYATTTNGNYAHSEGHNSIATGESSHAEGDSTTASGSDSHAEGYNTEASGSNSHAEGRKTLASNPCDHAEGDSTTASGGRSHAEGDSSVASGNTSHAEGDSTTASGNYSHAEGYQTIANGMSSHAEGENTEAKSDYSHAEGIGTIASADGQHVQGMYNISDLDERYLHVVGNGTSSNRSNAHTIDRYGNAWFSGDVYVGGTEQDDSASLKLMTQPIAKTVSLTIDGWDTTSLTQTVTVTGVLENETKQAISCTPSVESQTAYFDAGVRCMSQAEDSLTFICSEVPAAALEVYVMIHDVSFVIDYTSSYNKILAAAAFSTNADPASLTPPTFNDTEVAALMASPDLEMGLSFNSFTNFATACAMVYQLAASGEADATILEEQVYHGYIYPMFAAIGDTPTSGSASTLQDTGSLYIQFSTPARGDLYWYISYTDFEQLIQIVGM